MAYKIMFSLSVGFVMLGAYCITWKTKTTPYGSIKHREFNFGWFCFFLALACAAAGWTLI